MIRVSQHRTAERAESKDPWSTNAVSIPRISQCDFKDTDLAYNRKTPGRETESNDEVMEG